ncbi:MAG: type VI secretion system baseplate subunit TssF [Phycisphaerales bacterium]|nr:type VI secretion system baseplate subunit TssF [Phycisphaerales bacterium]
MDRRLLRYYEQELRHLQGVAREFAREYPKIAARLAIDDLQDTCVDPYVERLLEGFAFLASRVQLKLDAEFPRFTQNLLQAVYPHYLAPTPSMCIVEFAPDYGDAELASGYTLPRGSSLRSLLGKQERTSCEYRTAQDVTIYPIKLLQAQYYTRDFGVLDLAQTVSSVAPIRGALRIRLAATAGLTFSKLTLDRLVLNLRGGGMTPMRLYEQIHGHCKGIVVRPVVPAGTRAPRTAALMPTSAISRVGFEEDEALLPYDARSFQGYRLLHEYFSFPQRFLFAGISGLRQHLAGCQFSEVDIVLLFDEESAELENVVGTEHVGLHSTPAINLFPKRADRIFVTERFSEFQVLPDRTRPLDFEVYSVHAVTGIGAQAEDQTVFRPFYAASDTDAGAGSTGAYFAANRVPRALSEREQRAGRRSSYAGSDVYISLVDSSSAPYSQEIRQLSIETFCTNRDLPLHMPVGRADTDFTLDVGAPVSATRVVSGPTAPRASHIEPKPGQSEGDLSWRLISHLSLNYLSISDAPATDGRGGSEVAQGAAALRDILRLYGDRGDPVVRKQVDGVRSVKVSPITRRIQTPGPIVFGRGLEVGVTLEEANFEGTGPFLLGAVLDHFFARYVSLNSFTETVISGADHGPIMRWPARLGRRSLL